MLEETNVANVLLYRIKSLFKSLKDKIFQEKLFDVKDVNEWKGSFINYFI